MSEPKRYALMGNPWEMVEHKNGNLVSYEDYARLKAEVERLTKAGDDMAKVIDADATAWFERVVRDWNAAKEGKGQP